MNLIRRDAFVIEWRVPPGVNYTIYCHNVPYHTTSYTMMIYRIKSYHTMSDDLVFPHEPKDEVADAVLREDANLYV